MGEVCDEPLGGGDRHTCELHCSGKLLGGGVLSELTRSLCQRGWLSGIIKNLESPTGNVA